MEAMNHHQLLKAVKRGNLEEFEELGRNTDLLKALSPQENTALHVAARFGHTDLVQEILRRQNLLLVVRNLKGDTPMHVAASAGNNDVINSLIDCAKAIEVAALISQAKKISKKKHNYRYPHTTGDWVAAIVVNTIWAIVLVIKWAIRAITWQTTPPNTTDIESGSEGVQKVLRMRDGKGNTPLHGAVLNRRLEVVEILVREDPQLIILTNEAGKSPLSIAVDVKASDILRKIVSLNTSSSLSHIGHSGQTLLHSTIVRNDLASMKIVLEKCPQLIRKKDMNGRSPLHYAAASGYPEMVERLLKCDASRSLAYEGDESGQTPVHMAAESGHVSVLTKLLDECPDSIELLDRKHRNLLHLAAQNGKIDTVEYLLKLPEMEDLVNEPDKDKNTPLHLSAKNLHSDVVHSLLQEPRVNIWATNVYGTTAQRAVEYSLDLQVSSVNGEADMTKIGNIADSAGAKTMELRKLLKEARATRAGYPKDILERRYPRKITHNDRQMAKTLMTIATLVAAFTFTAVFNVPGGFTNGNEDEGMAALSTKVAFQLFVIFDTIAMTSSMTAAVIVFSSPWNNELFAYVLSIAMVLTWIALLTMGLAFVTGLFAVLSNTMWLAIVVCVIGGAYPTIVCVVTPLVFLAGLPFARDIIFGIIARLSGSQKTSLDVVIEILSASFPISRFSRFTRI